MAVKDHSLDGKIISAARAEFLEHGYRKASLHKIADRAGLTTGALYTRYKNKDDLFLSLVSELMRTVGAQMEPMRKEYEQAQKAGTPQAMLEAIRREERLYLNLLFDHYEDCVLFFCRSGGSSIEKLVNDMMEMKSCQTVEFIRSMAKKPFEPAWISMLMEGQFHFYRQVLERGYTREKAFCCLEEMTVFMEAGWKAFFEKIL